MATNDLPKIASRAAIITSIPILCMTAVIGVFAVAAFVLGLANTRENHNLCGVLKQDSVIYIKQAELADGAETRAEASTAPQTHMWLIQGALDRELALQNASLCGFPAPTPTVTPAPKGTRTK